MESNFFGSLSVNDDNISHQVAKMGSSKILVIDSSAEVDLSELPDYVTSILVCSSPNFEKYTDSLREFLDYARLKNPNIIVSDLMNSPVN